MARAGHVPFTRLSSGSRAMFQRLVCAGTLLLVRELFVPGHLDRFELSFA
jgi:hypothetical protein